MAKNILLIISFLVVSTNICSLPLNTTCETCIFHESCPTALDLVKLDNMEAFKNMICETTPKVKVCCPTDNIIFIDQPIKKHVSLVQPMPNKLQTTPKDITTVLEDTTTELQTTTRKTEEITEELPALSTLTLPLDPLPDRNICGKMGASSRIYSGQVADIDEFPWLARIGYKIDGKVTFACAASLITDRYLITAAHCLRTKNIVGVRLGEYDELTSVDCKEGQCSPKPIDRKILETIIFPGYDSTLKTYGDIALIKLEKPVNFTEYVRPICLPTTDYVKMQDYVQGSSYWATGWGVTEYDTVSTIKRKVSLDAVSSHVCQAIYPQISKLSFSQIICAGGTLGKDTCSGDSGGPLMRAVKENYQENWYIYGIISFGLSHCGSEGRPGFYTRVTKYMDWIQKTISN